MKPDRFLAGTNPAEMSIWAQGDDTTAVGTAIAFKIEAGGETVEIPGGAAMAMDLEVAATRTDFGPWPGIVFALLKNILEADGDKRYHVARL